MYLHMMEHTRHLSSDYPVGKVLLHEQMCIYCMTEIISSQGADMARVHSVTSFSKNMWPLS